MAVSGSLAPSTWQGRWGLYLEDLFVRPAWRGRGIGKALLVELARTAVREGCGRFDWNVLRWNEPARSDRVVFIPEDVNVNNDSDAGFGEMVPPD